MHIAQSRPLVNGFFVISITSAIKPIRVAESRQTGCRVSRDCQKSGMSRAAHQFCRTHSGKRRHDPLHQELLGHADVKTTEICPHVISHDIRGLYIPLDKLRPVPTIEVLAETVPRSWQEEERD